ncbi:DUF6262 family protein [Actinacidiphila sp. ITFR-21]|uniref:DUF6262 family protein n=1 Tax=Actinacidiphila sp. ITFR-21 TaxID=3075199 RepID=UPI00288A751C|nr:DUF6262 family protein [Streptomyces sp. ITFR-21]WNI16955.1 DUF6262 family protein [Streptomyces sp. ITFR-21]WNI20161.1 DUF6262 family protein [Streptomyces sp. ITFR-21]
MSAEAKRRPADVLREARRKDSQEKRARVLARVDEMKAAGQAITCATVARAAEVSVWLVYQPEIKQYIDKARGQQELAGDRGTETGTAVSQGSLAVDLQLARAELKAVVKERDELRDALRRKLGQQVESAASEDVAARVRVLEEDARSRNRELAALSEERDRLQEELAEAQDDLIASREARRRLMQEVNRKDPGE